MARYDRNRGMYFGSWTGNNIAEEGTISTDIDSTVATVEFETGGVADFGTQVAGSGEYVFYYNATTSSWELNSATVTLATYGITVTTQTGKTLSDGDSITVNYTKASGGWEALGKDNDDLTKDLNPDTETSKNVLGESTFRHSGYEPSVSVDPYYIDPSRKMYKRIRENAIEEKYGENDLKGYFAEAFFETKNTKKRTMSGYCFVREAWYVPQSTGGDTTAYAIPVEIHPVGAAIKKNIVYDMETNEATITDIT